MLKQMPILTACAVLAIAPSAGASIGTAGRSDAAEQSQPASDAQAFSIAAGQILGAATACDQIEEDRVSADATRTVAIIATNAVDEKDDASARALLIDNAGRGQQAVVIGDVDCSYVDASLMQLEQVEQGSDQQDRDNQGQPQGQAQPQDRGQPEIDITPVGP